MQTDFKRHTTHLEKSIESSILACIIKINGKDYDQSLCLVCKLHTLKHVLWAMASTNNSDYIGVCVCVRGGVRG